MWCFYMPIISFIYALYLGMLYTDEVVEVHITYPKCDYKSYSVIKGNKLGIWCSTFYFVRVIQLVYVSLMCPNMRTIAAKSAGERP